MWEVLALNSWSHLSPCFSWKETFEIPYLAEVHALHPFASQCRADRRAWAGLTRAYYQLDDLISLYRLPRHRILPAVAGQDDLCWSMGRGTCTFLFV